MGTRTYTPQPPITELPSLLAEWDWETNLGLDPSEISAGSQLKVGWVCPKDHTWVAKVGKRSRGSGCPQCQGRVVIAGSNDLATVFPLVAAEWDFEGNGSLLPTQVMAHSRTVVRWVCPENHKWSSAVSTRTSPERGCATCAGQRATPGINDLATTHPNLIVEWDPQRNLIGPDQVSRGSAYKAHWICAPHAHRWQSRVASRAVDGVGCPKCFSMGASKVETSLRDSLRAKGMTVSEDERLEVPWGTQTYSRVDIILPLAKVVVEYDGCYWHNGNESRDTKKSEGLIAAGWTVLRVREGSLGYLPPMGGLIQLPYDFFSYDVDALAERIIIKLSAQFKRGQF